MSLQLAFLLDANFVKSKVFKGLITQIKNLLTQWKTKKKNHKYKNSGDKKSPSLRKETREEKRELE